MTTGNLSISERRKEVFLYIIGGVSGIFSGYSYMSYAESAFTEMESISWVYPGLIFGALLYGCLVFFHTPFRPGSLFSKVFKPIAFIVATTLVWAIAHTLVWAAGVASFGLFVSPAIFFASYIGTYLMVLLLWFFNMKVAGRASLRILIVSIFVALSSFSFDQAAFVIVMWQIGMFPLLARVTVRTLVPEEKKSVGEWWSDLNDEPTSASMKTIE